MGIVAVGIDVVDIARFQRELDRAPRLCERLFTPQERDLAPASLAARFAAKEALAKVLGAPVGLNWQHATVHRHRGRAPELVISDSVAARAAELGITRFHVSLSHDAGIASAVVVAEG